jgi:hypothetical protein
MHPRKGKMLATLGYMISLVSTPLGSALSGSLRWDAGAHGSGLACPFGMR